MLVPLRELRQDEQVKITLLASFMALGAAASLPAQVSDPSLAQLPANASNVLVVRDMLPPVEALLRTPQVAELLLATADLQQRTLGRSFSGPELLKQLQLVRAFVPLRAAFGIDAASIDGLVELGRVGLLDTVLRVADRQEGVAASTLAVLRESCQSALTKLRPPSGVVVVELRDERLAESWLDSALELARSMAADPAITVAEADAAVTVRFDVFALDDGRLRKQLAASGVELPKDLTLPIDLHLEQRGGELSLRIGEPAAGPLAADSLGEQWRDDATQVLFSRFDLSAVAPALADEAARVRMLTEDVPSLQSFATKVAALQVQMEELALPSTGSVRLADGIDFVSESDLGEGAEAFEAPPEGLLRCVRPDDGPFQVSSLPLPILLAAALAEVKQRLGRKGQSLDLLDALFEGFDDDEALEVFGWGAVMVSRKAAFRGAPGWQAGPLPFASVAVLGVLEDGADCDAFLRELMVRCGDAIGGDRPVFQERDVGLGVPTHLLRLDLMPAPFGPEVDADWSPHWFVVDDVLVLSTDVGWSRELIGRLRGESALQLPGGRVINWSLWQSEHLAACLEAVAQWVSVLGEAKPFLADFMAVGAAAVRAIERFEWISELAGTKLRTRLELRLAKPSTRAK